MGRSGLDLIVGPLIRLARPEGIGEKKKMRVKMNIVMSSLLASHRSRSYPNA